MFRQVLQKSVKSGIRQRSFNSVAAAANPDFLTVDDPYTGEISFKTEWTSRENLDFLTDKAKQQQRYFARNSDLEERIKICQNVMAYFEEKADEVAQDITKQMGKPFSQSLGEIKGMRERVDAMIELSRKSLANPAESHPKEGFKLEVRREPVGVVLTLAPWNYPLLTAVNSIIPAFLAGNAVLISHGHRTPKISLHFERAFQASGSPEGLVAGFTSHHETTNHFIRSGGADFVSFTGSVTGGEAIYESVSQTSLFAKKFVDCTLELGGKDAAYVRHDADVMQAAETVADAGFYNAGQSCCGLERVYVHEAVYDTFMEELVRLADSYVLGDPFTSDTTMGPMAQPHAVAELQGQVDQAVSLGAELLSGGRAFSHAGNGRFFLPTLLAHCTPEMRVMEIESFGPILGIARVSSDAEAVEMVNNSDYGLTAAVFSRDLEAVESIAGKLQVGTVFANRADYLDPMLPWQGRKLTGLGCSLSSFGFAPYTKLKNFHFRQLS